MNKPLDPMSVDKAETPSASYVLRRRYGPARHVITFASWVTVLNMILQPVAVLAATYTWDNGGSDNAWSTVQNWSGTPDNTEPTASDGAVFPTPVVGSGTITLSSGEAALSLTFNDSYTLSGGGLTLNGGGLTVAAGTVTISSPITLGANQTWTHNSANTLTVSSLAFNSKDLTVGGTGNTTINASGSGRIIKSGNGTATLTGNNTMTSLFPGGGTLILSGTTTVTASSYMQGANQTLRLEGSALTWSGTYIRVIESGMAGSTSVLQILHNGDNGGTDPNVSNYSGVVFQQYNPGTTTFYVDRVSGTGTGKTVKFNAMYTPNASGSTSSIWNFTGANGYGISFSASIGYGFSVPAGTPLVLKADVPVTFGAANPCTVGNTTTDMTGSSTLTINGALNGGGASAVFNQNGTGTTILAGGGNFNGAINVKQGTLLVNGASALGTGGSQAVTVGGNGTSGTPTLGGTGTISRPVTIAAAGTGVAGHLAPGVGGIGTLTVNNTLALAGVGDFQIDKTGGTLTNDKVIGLTAAPDVTGATLNVTITGSGFADGDKWKLFTWTGGGNITGTIAAAPANVPSDFRWKNFGTASEPNYINPATGEIQLFVPTGTVIRFR